MIAMFLFFHSIGVFFHDHSRITGLQGKGKGISVTPHYHFHPLRGYFDIGRAIAVERSLLHIGSSRNRTRNLWFPSASRFTTKLRALSLYVMKRSLILCYHSKVILLISIYLSIYASLSIYLSTYVTV